MSGDAPRSTKRRWWRGRRIARVPTRSLIADGLLAIVAGVLLGVAAEIFGGPAFEHGSVRDSGFFFFVMLLAGLVVGWGVVRRARAWREWRADRER